MKSGQVKVNEKVESILLKIQSIVADQVEGDYKLFLFGSRANGKSMERSDIDIAIMTNAYFYHWLYQRPIAGNPSTFDCRSSIVNYKW